MTEPDQIQVIDLKSEWRPEDDGTVSLRLTVTGLTGEQLDTIGIDLVDILKEALNRHGQVLTDRSLNDSVQ